MNKYYVYIIISSKDGRLYKGITDNVVRRLKEHNEGKTKSTKGYIPWELLLLEEFNTRKEAREREIYYKSGVGREDLKKIIRSRSSTG